MNITDIRVSLITRRNSKILAYCDMIIDNCFIVRGIKIIQGKKDPFIAMPSKPMTDKCPRCKNRNEITAKFCGRCGLQLGTDRIIRDPKTNKPILDQDVVHPINTLARQEISKKLLDAYHAEVGRRRQPGQPTMTQEPQTKT